MIRLLLVVLILTALLSGCGKSPETFDELREAGVAAYIDQDYQEARDLLAQAVAKKPSDRDANYFLGLAYHKDYFIDSALFYLKRVDILYPNDVEVNRKIYDIANKAGAWEEAKDALRSLIRAGEPEGQFYEDLARLYGQLDNRLSVLYYRKKLLEGDPDNPQRYLDVANAAVGTDSVDLSFVTLDSAMERFGRQREFVTNKGMFFVFLRRFDEAEPLFREVLAMDTTSISAKLNLANALSSLESKAKKREALAIYRGIRDVVAADVPVDSLIEVLQAELK